MAGSDQLRSPTTAESHEKGGTGPGTSGYGQQHHALDGGLKKELGGRSQLRSGEGVVGHWKRWSGGSGTTGRGGSGMADESDEDVVGVQENGERREAPRSELDRQAEAEWMMGENLGEVLNVPTREHWKVSYIKKPKKKA